MNMYEIYRHCHNVSHDAEFLIYDNYESFRGYYGKARAYIQKGKLKDFTIDQQDFPVDLFRLETDEDDDSTIVRIYAPRWKRK